MYKLLFTSALLIVCRAAYIPYNENDIYSGSGNSGSGDNIGSGGSNIYSRIIIHDKKYHDDDINLTEKINNKLLYLLPVSIIIPVLVLIFIYLCRINYAKKNEKKIFYKFQLIVTIFFSFKNSLHFIKCLHPKNPLPAE